MGFRDAFHSAVNCQGDTKKHTAFLYSLGGLGALPVLLSTGVVVAVLRGCDIVEAINRKWLARPIDNVNGILEEGLQVVWDLDLWEEEM